MIQVGGGHPELSESDFQNTIIDCAHLSGWLVHHVRPAWSNKGWRTPIQGDVGFPDLVLSRGSDILFVEVKREKGRLTRAQELWLAALAGNPEVNVFVWKPSDWDDIERILR